MRNQDGCLSEGPTGSISPGAEAAQQAAVCPMHSLEKAAKGGACGRREAGQGDGIRAVSRGQMVGGQRRHLDFIPNVKGS